MVQRIVALCGKARAGKDAVADHLTRAHGMRKLKFAAPLKRAVAALFDISPEDLEGEAKDAVDPRLGLTPRRLMQWLGTDVLQHALPPDFASSTIGPTFLATRLACWDIREDGPDVVVSDMRFRHEHAALQRRAEQLGARYLAIRLVRPTTTTALGALEAGHVSETESDRIPHHIVVLNDGTLQDLYRKIDDHMCAPAAPPTK